MNKKIYYERKEKGLCVTCEKPLDRKGVYCTECNEKRSQRQKELREKKKLDGICSRCGNPTDGNSFSLCQSCLDKENERNRKNYAELIQAGICTKCKKEPAMNGKRICKSCSEKTNKRNAEIKKYYISIGICPRCKKEHIFPNEKSCPVCKAKEVDRRKEQYENNIEKEREIAKKSYKKRREEKIERGLCVKCGKRTPIFGKKYCEYCLAKTREYNQSRRRELGISSVYERRERTDNGLCWFCGNPVKDGYKVCEKCYQRCVKNATSENANKARKEMIKNGILY